MNKRIYIQGFNERIEEAVYESGYTKKKIAEMAGFERKVLFMNDNKMISSGYLAKFCAITGFSADYLLGLSKKKRINK